MATIVNTPGPERVVEVRRTDSSGWAIAVIILLIVIAAGAYVWMHYYRAAPAPSGGTNINVTLPSGTTDTSGNTSGQ